MCLVFFLLGIFYSFTYFSRKLEQGQLMRIPNGYRTQVATTFNIYETSNSDVFVMSEVAPYKVADVASYFVHS